MRVFALDAHSDLGVVKPLVVYSGARYLRHECRLSNIALVS